MCRTRGHVYLATPHDINYFSQRESSLSMRASLYRVFLKELNNDILSQKAVFFTQRSAMVNQAT
jgi:hypothetical protein